MIRIKEIQEALRPVVGWEQDFTPENMIDEALTVTESGLVFQGAHPLCTLDNVRAVMPDVFVGNYPRWNSLLRYKVGDKVQHKGQVYIAKSHQLRILTTTTTTTTALTTGYRTI